MSKQFDCSGICCASAVRPYLLAIFCLVLISGCSYHPPAPIEEHSSAIVKRQLNSDGSYYVRSGDTLYAIAFAYGADPMKLAKWNDISSPYVIYPGQKLKLSASASGNRSRGSSSGVQITTIKEPGRTTTRSVTSPTKPAQSKPASKPSTTPPVVSKATGAESAGNTSAGKSSGSTNWKWPTNGKVRRTYLAGNPARNGLDITGKEGQRIIAASDGQVVYSGNGLIGYGELIIIKHNEKMLSAYAHNKVRLVSEGDQVSAGQKIAEMGRNSSDEQLLHFEIRAHGKPVDPIIYLPKK